MTAKDDAEKTLALLDGREPQTPVERMAKYGAQCTLKRLKRLDDYRRRNNARLLEYARIKAAERRAAKKAMGEK